MKRLLLLRHAKSSWDDPSLADFERPLSPRGLKAAPRMGRELAARDWLPDRALVSPAVRTHATWDLVAAQWPAHPPVTFPETLYDATPEEILGELRSTPERASTLLVVAHNPGLQQFADRLAGGTSDEKALARLRQRFPTAGLVRLVFDGRWRDLGFDGARLTHCLRPKDLG
jgi:phosphohistidine phosphatase